MFIHSFYFHQDETNSRSLIQNSSSSLAVVFEQLLSLVWFCARICMKTFVSRWLHEYRKISNEISSSTVDKYLQLDEINLPSSMYRDASC